MVVSGIVSALVSGGGDMWLNRFTGRATTLRHRAPYLWRPYLAICGGTAGLVSTIGIAIAFLLPISEQVRLVAVIMLIGAVAAGFTEAELAVLRASGKVTAFFASRDLLIPLLYLSAIIVLRPESAAGVLAIHATLWTLALVLIALVVWQHIPMPRSTAGLGRIGQRRLLQHTLGLQAGNLSHRLAIQLDVLVLTWIVSLGAVGEYRLAAQFATGFAVVQHFVFLGLPWQMRQSGRRQDMGSMRGRSARIGQVDVLRRQRLLLGITTVALLVGWAIAEPFLGFIAPRFVDSAWLLRLLLLIRFTELLWGPQHEILISNGLPQRDAGANIAAIGVWVLAFFPLLIFFDPISATVAAGVVASATGQVVRYRALFHARLTPASGHPLGAALPLTLSTGTLIAALTIL